MTSPRVVGPHDGHLAILGGTSHFRALGAGLLNGPPDPQWMAALCARYALDMDMGSVPDLVQRFGVRFPGGPLPAPR